MNQLEVLIESIVARLENLEKELSRSTEFLEKFADELIERSKRQEDKDG